SSRALQSRHLRVTHQLESRMREIRTSGSEGGVGSIPHPYLYPSPLTADTLTPSPFPAALNPCSTAGTA
ncbi:MAG: hypothetical protein J0M24_28265, partial [Verrucomicrobia bacterium]|nr:hypothetical protein [Verrucomicrobiota bacterium]